MTYQVIEKRDEDVYRSVRVARRKANLTLDAGGSAPTVDRYIVS